MGDRIRTADTEPARLALAREVTRRLASTSEARASFLAGGLIEGLGSHTSDFDVYLVRTSASPGRRQLSLDRTTRIDVHEVSPEQLEHVVDRVGDTESTSDGTAPSLSSGELKLATRLHAAEIVSGSAEMTPLRERLRDGDRLRRHVMSSWLTLAHSELEDFAGLRASGDVNAAIMVGRDALVAAGKAVAAAQGDLYLGRKWVWRQLGRSAPGDFPMACFQELVNGEPAGSGAGHGLTDLITFTRTCLAAVATVGWHGISLDRWGAWRRADGPLNRDDGFHPRAYDDGVVLTKPAERWVLLKPDVALVWGLCNGSSMERVAAQAANLREAGHAYQELTRDRCRDIITRLIEWELVHRR